jgi:hypothetical protein
MPAPSVPGVNVGIPAEFVLDVPRCHGHNVDDDERNFSCCGVLRVMT